jgi:hypothetical protein
MKSILNVVFTAFIAEFKIAVKAVVLQMINDYLFRPKTPEMDEQEPLPRYVVNPNSATNEHNEHVILVAFHMSADTMQQAQIKLMPNLPVPGEDIGLEEWWIAEDERYDGSDNDSAVFVPGSGQKFERQGVDEDPIPDDLYERVFTEGNKNWAHRGDYNQLFLRVQQDYFNDVLGEQGHVFLNEVYDALGFERTSAGAIMGWFLGADARGFIDFGLSNPDHFADDGDILVTFNVESTPIYTRI